MDNRHETMERDFDEIGYVEIRQFIRGGELDTLLANLDRFIRDVVPTMPREQVYYEDRSDWSTLKQIQHLDDHDPYFHDLSVASRFRNVAEQLLNGSVVPKNIQYFNKMPGVGQPTPHIRTASTS